MSPAWCILPGAVGAVLRIRARYVRSQSPVEGFSPAMPGSENAGGGAS